MTLFCLFKKLITKPVIANKRKHFYVTNGLNLSKQFVGLSKFSHMPGISGYY